MRPLISDAALSAFGEWFTGWPLACLCYGVVGYLVMLRFRW